MLETGKPYSALRKLLIAVFVVFAGIVRFPQGAEAKITVQKAGWHVDSATIQKGYTFATAANEILLGMPSASINPGEENEVWVELKQIKKRRVVIAKPKKLLGKIYAYSVYNTDNTVSVSAPLWLSVLWDTNTNADHDYVIKSWDAENQKWNPLETTVHADEKRASTTVNSATGIVAVFAKKHVEESVDLRGAASWYNWYGAAMNDLPLGTKIEVENPDTGAKATTVVVSTGPFVPGRIIDLPKEVFAAIGSVSSGVMQVIVRPID